MAFTVQEIPISPSFKKKGKIKPISFELIYNPPFDIVAKDIYELVRIINNDLCSFLKRIVVLNKKTFGSIFHFEQNETFFKIETSKEVESNHEGYRIL